MKFLIFEARKEQENSTLYLSGCFRPTKDSKDDEKVLNTMIEAVKKYALDKVKSITLEQGALFIRKEPYKSLATVLKILSTNVSISIKPAKNIKYVGNIDEAELLQVFDSMSVSINKKKKGVW